MTINSTGKTFSMTGWKVGYAKLVPLAVGCVTKSVTSLVTFCERRRHSSGAKWQMRIELSLKSNGYCYDLRDYHARRMLLLRDNFRNAGFAAGGTGQLLPC